MQDLLIENIHNVCAAEYDREYCRLDDSLKSRIDRMKNIDSKHRTLLGRMLARNAVRHVCGADADGISISVDARGKPYAPGYDCCISISHSGDWVVCAFGTSVVGVDIELVRTIDIRLVKRVCTTNEYEYVLGSHMQEFGMITDVDVLRRFFEIWTLKEAYFKALGTGITNFKSDDVLASERERRTYYSDGYVISVIYA